MKTTLFYSGNCHTEKAAILEKGLTLEIKLGPLFQGLVCPKYSDRVGSQGPPGHDIVPILHNPSNEWASNLCFTEKIEDIHVHFMINISAH